MTDQLVIPDSLKPSDGRFGSGPSKVRPEQLEALLAQGRTVLGTSHRQPPVKRLVAALRSGLAELLGAPDGYEIVVGMGGTNAFWDAASFALLRDRGAFAVCGEFGAKFATVARNAPFLADPIVAEVEPGTSVQLQTSHGVDAYCWTQNETSTGVVTPVRRVAGSGEELMLVDATSAAGAVQIDLAEADAYYFAPQKVFASDGGLWFAAMSPAALERIETLSAQRWIPATLDLQVCVDNSRLDQTYNTPAVTTLALAAAQVEWMLDNGGLSWAAGRSAASSTTLYEWAERTSYTSPFVEDPANRSPVVGTIDFEGVDAAAVAKTLRANGIVDTEPYRKLGRNQLRIGMYPAVEPEDVAALTACIDYVAEHL
ncbi:phosphoserine aminotransferase [Flexivirga endophytica]|uniref:phosphoserine transaminase n=1 Tax=Flexivirga endophytica TaxID=1849103 RepID=A0A916X0M9_9MICO|nr:phosphoserine transaminase [Flexivirga endophytica]GGB44153.1 phosphoserine aminotransferase [Flexivirga endophytica]GHB60042.1 phosphoserine aminotransferase [Flexivirga endophytica]